MARIQYASKYASSSNYYKFSIGQNKGLKDLNVVQQKKELEDRFTQWVNADEARKKKYGNALGIIAEAYSHQDLFKAQEYMQEAFLRGPEIFLQAIRIQTLLGLLDNKSVDQDRIARYIADLKESMQDFYKDYSAPTDQKVAAALMQLYAQNNAPKYYPAFYNTVIKRYKGDFSKYAEKMFSKTIFRSWETLNAFLDDPNPKVLEKDMAYQAATDIYDKYEELGQLTSQENDNLLEGRRLFLAGLMEMEKNKIFYPDANSTMRLTYGKVLEYEPRDGVIYKYYTTTKGYLEKEIPGDIEFDVPPRMKELVIAKDFGRYADKDGTLHTDFITNNDITGGNSGSPVINGEGQLIGIACDGNWEAMSGDIAFEPELQRCINVDIRFVLWVIDVYAGAGHLVDEMEIIE